MRPFRKLYYQWLRKSTQGFQPVILVTGCGSGIGRALAKVLYEKTRYRVVITAREHSLPQLRNDFPENGRFLIRSLDVTSEFGRETLFDELKEKWGGVHVLVNNAGISYRAVVEHMSEVDEIRQMSTNYFGPMGLIRLVLPGMREKGRGKIICVSSVSGMLAMPTMASYSASKYALEGACEALWYECRPLGIDITLVQPGFINSNSFHNVLYSEKSHPDFVKDGPYHDYYENMGPFVAKMMKRSFSTPEKIAKEILQVIQTEAPPLWWPATLDALVFYYIRRLFPRRLLLPFLFACLPGARKWAKAYSQKRELK